MKSWKDRKALVTSEVPSPREALAAKGVGAAADGPPTNPPEDVVNWLAQLTLLHGVPFEYLVPYEALLPTESLRFFYVDDNWLDRLVDGAISIGVSSTQDNAFNAAWYETLYAEVAAARGNLRARLRGATDPDVQTTTLSGFLLRSVAVSAWPGLEVEGLDESGAPLPILRLERLSDTVLLGVFSGVPKTVRFVEPGEGLHFGLLDSGTPGKEPSEIVVRGLGLPASTPLTAGKSVPSSESPDGFLVAPACFRPGAAPGVLKLEALRDAIAAAITSDKVDGDPGQAALPEGGVTPAAFAIEMVRGAGRMSYETPTSSERSPS